MVLNKSLFCILNFVILLQVFQNVENYGLNSIIGRLNNVVGAVDKLCITCLYTYRSTRQNRLSHILEPEYDFIIIGGGSSGSIIANRLSENPKWKILLLEAGRTPDNLTEIPYYTSMVRSSSSYSWNYTMEKQNNSCLGMLEEKCTWPSAKVFGGSSVIDNSIYARGTPNDFKNWEKLGNTKWSYEDVLPYYLKSEECNIEDYCKNTKYHNSSGYQTISYGYNSPTSQAFIDAGLENGYDTIDYNNPDTPFGFSKIQSQIKNGKRVHASKLLLEPIKNRNNLLVLTSMKVRRIIIDQDKLQATGVLIQKGKQKHIIKALKEVIVSAGVINSAKLLMLSGIGPNKLLTKIKLPVLKNLAVGTNIMDQIIFPGLVFITNETILNEDMFNHQERIKYVYGNKGIFTSSGFEAIANIKLKNESTPIIQLLFSSSGSFQSRFNKYYKNYLRLKPEIYETVFKPLKNKTYWIVFPVLLHPKSKGNLKLRSSNWKQPPLLYGNFYTDPNNEDLNNMLQAIKYVIKLSQSNAFQKYNSKLHDVRLLGCENFEFSSDDYWICSLKLLTVSNSFNQIGSCKMGPFNDSSSVVDDNFKVHGVKSLRVVDKSVIPVTISGNTAATALMIGERAADKIKYSWELS